MIIFDEEIISSLCDEHLKTMWLELWKIYKALQANNNTSIKNAQEFKIAPLHLAHRMTLVYNQILKRRLRTPLKPPNPFDVSDTPFTQILKELKQYVPKYTRKAQLNYLNDLKCACRKGAL